MNPIYGHAIGVMVSLIMAFFIGIWIWAWRGRHRRTFDRLARIPMQDPVEADIEAQATTRNSFHHPLAEGERDE